MPVLLFYHYCDVADPAALAVQQRHLCHSLGLTGRVRVASEGINATLGGDRAACAAYERELASDPRFGAVEFKRGEGGAGDFDGLLVKESTEIVTLGIPPTELSFRDGGARLSPAQFREGVMAVAAATRCSSTAATPTSRASAASTARWRRRRGSSATSRRGAESTGASCRGATC